MQRCSYGETVIDAVLLMTLPIEAVTVTVPPLVKPATPETRPADTVARLVLLEVHVATLVTSTGALLLHGVAVAVSCTVKAVLLLTEPLVGFIVIEVTHWLTVTVCVPVIDGFALAVAVTVAVPRATDVTKPVEDSCHTCGSNGPGDWHVVSSAAIVVGAEHSHLHCVIGGSSDQDGGRCRTDYDG